jgi:hypothetical protein
VSDAKYTAAELELSAGNVLRRLQTPALGIGAIALAACLVGAMIEPQQFFRAYLIAFIYWLAMALGSNALLMMQYVTGGRWGAAIRRPLEAGASNVPLMAVFFIPVALGMHWIYPWANPDMVAHSAVLQFKSGYLNPTMFVVRAVIYFTIWSTLATRLVAWSRQEDLGGFDKTLAGRKSVFSHAGIVVWGLSMSLASVDWAMSIEPAWFSHIFPLMFTAAQILTAMTLAIQVSALMADHKPVSDVLSSGRFHDVGKLLLAFVMLWGYFQLSQWIIMWGANLPEEIGWYVVRNQNGWQYLTYTLFTLHFVVPFGMLLSESRKQAPRRLAAVAALLCVMRWVDVYWWLTPSFSPDAFWISPLHLTSVLGIGGIWMWRYIGTLSSHPIVALHDPIIATELEHA